MQDEYLERVKAEIRQEAEAARVRAPLPRLDPPPREQHRAAVDDGIDRARLDYTIAELTGADYSAFIDQAFRAVLKRAPDDAGSEMQVRLLAAGVAKAEVLGNLRWSPEGRRLGVHVRGLWPRYVLAKLTRVPVVGYFVEWGLALAGLPMLLRHQRAADTSIAARFNAAADAQRQSEQRIGELAAAHASLSAEHDRRSQELREEIRRLQLRVDELERQAAQLDTRAHGLETRTDAAAHEMVGLRHYVHTAHHWIASLQRGVEEIDAADAAERYRADRLLAGIDIDAGEAAARSERHAGWSAALAERLPAGARVLDLGSADGAWIDALAARGFDASGVERNAVLTARAQQRGVRVALGDAQAVLERCADASLDGVTMAVGMLAPDARVAALMLDEVRRVLKPQASLLVRIESDVRVDIGAPVPDAQHCMRVLAAAGYSAPTLLTVAGASAVLALRGA